MAVRFFTLEEAESLLPRVREHLDRVLQLHVLIRTAVSELAGRGIDLTPALLAGREAPETSEALVGRVRGMYQVIRDELVAVDALGVQVKGVETGLVDFPSWLDGETEVLLCWKRGEDHIRFFHTLDAGFAGRQPVHGRIFRSTGGSTSASQRAP